MVRQAPAVQVWQEAVAGLIDKCGTSDFPDALLDALQLLVISDSAVIVGLEDDTPPKVFCDRLAQGIKANFYGDWMTGAYRASPFYVTFVDRKPDGFYTVRGLVPAGFEDSEYYQAYFRHLGLVDVGAYLVWLTATKAILLAFARKDTGAVFDKPELRRLQLVQPVVAALVRKHWRAAVSLGVSGSAIHEKLARRAAAFGAGELTERERDVVRLLLRGHSTKSLAMVLGITPGTAQVHRQNIYRKLEVSTQGDLFAYFVDYLMGPW